VRFSARYDTENIERGLILTCASPEAERALRRWAELEARSLIKSRWHEVEAVAAALLERDTLTGPELVAVIEAAGRAYRAWLAAGRAYAAQLAGPEPEHATT
jgi:hypothetical protein